MKNKNFEKEVIRKFKDIKEIFKNSNIKNNPLIYRVLIKSLGNHELGLTIIEPGSINKEYYMTKGHKHKKAFSEVYILEEGKGKLVLQDKKIKIIELKKDKPIIVPEKTAHRLINTGNTKLKVLTLYHKDSGHDYSVKFKKRLLKK
ncbi:cupin domain-containing protein [Patescibacteria group bacterium]|nr:cupin domain-containing protein [Patescibacteria group bacterium]